MFPSLFPWLMRVDRQEDCEGFLICFLREILFLAWLLFIKENTRFFPLFSPTDSRETGMAKIRSYQVISLGTLLWPVLSRTLKRLMRLLVNFRLCLPLKASLFPQRIRK